MHHKYYTSSSYPGDILEVLPITDLTLLCSSLKTGVVIKVSMEMMMDGTDLVPHILQPGMRLKHTARDTVFVNYLDVVVLESLEYNGKFFWTSNYESKAGWLLKETEEYYLKNFVNLSNPPVKKSITNHTCPCGSPAYMGFTNIECTNVKCRNYRK